MRRGCPEHHVPGADHHDLAPIGIPARRWAESPDERETDKRRVVGIGLDACDIAVEDDDLSLFELARRKRGAEHQAKGLIFCSHASNSSSLRALQA